MREGLYNKSGREGWSMITGFNLRKPHLVISFIPGNLDMSDKLHRLSKVCLCINKLADIDLEGLEAIILDGVDDIPKS